MAEEEETLYLRVSVGDITIEVDGPVDDAETWFESLREDYMADVDSETVREQIQSSDGGQAHQDTQSGEEKTNSEKSRTLTEFYQMADGITKKDTAFLTGWFLEMKEGQDNFTKAEIEEKAQSAKLSLGKNVSRDLGYKVEDSHLAEIGERNGDPVYHVTINGQEYVEDELLDDQA